MTRPLDANSLSDSDALLGCIGSLLLTETEEDLSRRQCMTRTRLRSSVPPQHWRNALYLSHGVPAEAILRNKALPPVTFTCQICLSEESKDIEIIVDACTHSFCRYVLAEGVPAHDLT